MKENKDIFVFVVCGAQEHIDTLHYALQALRKVSEKEIIVVTDSARNETPVSHPNIIDYKTPENYSHHQASIFLKTGLPQFLPTGNRYCYLDTDIVAVGKNADSIFDHFVSPITFAPDHCVTDQFSPSAINCKCATEFAVWEKELKQLFKIHKDLIREPENEEKKAKLLHYLEEVKKDRLGYWLLSWRFNLARKIFKLNEDTFLNKQEHFWHDKNGAPILYEKNVQSSVEIIENTSPYRCQTDQQGIWTINGKNVFDCRCNHLTEAIKNTFAIDIQEEQWQHWNGGVFLFDDSSRDFLNAWHEKNNKDIFATRMENKRPRHANCHCMGVSTTISSYAFAKV
jgi:hypothetical protein